MAKLVTCPECTTQLALPEAASLSDRACCPRCGAKFALMESVQFSIPTAELLPPETEVESELDETPDVGAETVELPDFSSLTLDSFLSKATRDLITPVPAVDNFSSSAPSTWEQPAREPTVPAMENEAQASLADWQARLRRAIDAGQIAEDYVPEYADESSPDVSTLQASPTASAQKELLSSQNEFEVADADLLPASTPPSESVPQMRSWTFPQSESVDTHEEFAEDGYESEDSLDADEVSTRSLDEFQHAAAPIQVIAPDSLDTPRVAKPRPRRTPKMIATLASFGLGAIGIPLGLYALLWLKGPAGDVVHLADYLPQFMLPPAMRTTELDSAENLAGTPIVGGKSPSEQEELPLVAGTVAGQTDPDQFTIADPAVEPATAEQPVYRGPTFDLVAGAEFEDLLEVAQKAAAEFAEGTLSDKATMSRKGHAYIELCRLAGKCSFLNQPGRTAEESAASLAAEQMFQAVLSPASVRSDLSLVASRWWIYGERPNDGILLVGRITRVQETAAGNLAYLSLEGELADKEIPVLLGTSSRSLGTLVGVVGSIASEPGKLVPALEDLPLPIVVGHTSITLE